MQIIWTTTASLILKSDNTTVVFDPFFPIPLKPVKIGDAPGIYETREDKTEPEQTGGFEKLYKTADAVFLTHGHFDHMLYVPWLYKETDIPVYATLTPAKALIKKSMINGQIKTIRPGDTVRIGPFEIEVYPGKHCVFNIGIILKTAFSGRMIKNLFHMLQLSRLNKKYEENGETVYYDIKCEGKRTGILGSLNYSDEVTYPQEADVLVLPFQGRSDINRYALKVIKEFKPKNVFFDHFDDSFPPMSSEVGTGRFEKKLKKKGIGIIKPESGREYNV